MTVIVAECYRCVVAVVSTTTVVVPWTFVWRDRPALEQEVASCSDPCSWKEGREETAME
jgi:hypothetical protein